MKQPTLKHRHPDENQDFTYVFFAALGALTRAKDEPGLWVLKDHGFRIRHCAENLK